MKRTSLSVTTPAKRTRSKYNKKTSRKSFIPKTFVNQWSTGLPRTFNCVHKYVANGIFSSTASSYNASSVQFWTNGMFDPEVAVGGHQPMFFDQLGAMYNHYIVLRSTITVNFAPVSQPWVCGIYVDDDAVATYNALDVLCEQPSATFVTNNASGQSSTVSKSWDIKRAFGPFASGGTAYRGGPSTDPTETQSFRVFARPVDALTTTRDCAYTVTIKYYAMWSELKEMNSS